MYMHIEFNRNSVWKLNRELQNWNRILLQPRYILFNPSPTSSLWSSPHTMSCTQGYSQPPLLLVAHPTQCHALRVTHSLSSAQPQARLYIVSPPPHTLLCISLSPLCRLCFLRKRFRRWCSILERMQRALSPTQPSPFYIDL